MIDQLLQSQTDTVLDCGHPKSTSKISTGYATDKDGKTLCYDCCAKNDKIWMDCGNHQVLYLVESKGNYQNTKYYEATNWPGTLRIHVSDIKRKFKFSPKGFPIDRITVYFTLNNRKWSGTVGNFSTGSCFVARPLKEKK